MSLLPSRPEASPPDDAGPRVIGVDSQDADEVLSALSSETARALLTAIHQEPAPPSELADEVDTSLQNVQYHLENLQDAGAIEVVDTAYSAKGREMDVYAPSDQPLVIFAGDEGKGSTLKTALTRLLGAVGLLAAGSLVVQAVFGDGLSNLVGLGGAPASGGPDGGDMADGGAGGAAGDVGTATETPTSTTDVAAGGDGGDVATEVPTEIAQETDTADGAVGTMAEATETARETATEYVTMTETPVRTVTETATNVTTETPDAGADVARAAAETIPPGLVFFAGGLFVLGVLGVVWYGRTR